MGLKHGGYYLDCCWTLMGLLFAFGVMNLLWVAGISGFVLLEKITSASQPPLAVHRGVSLCSAHLGVRLQSNPAKSIHTRSCAFPDALHSHGGEGTMTIQVGGLYFCAFSFCASSSVANPTYTVITWPTLRSLTTAGGK